MDFGLQLAGMPTRVLIDAARRAEDLGFAAVYVPDHYVFERIGTLQPELATYDLFFVMTTLALRTSRIQIGSQVACMLFRHPVTTARLFAQIDELSGGRVIAGVGAGWTRAEFDMYGIPFPDVSERLRIMDEAVDVMRGLWANERFSYEGKHFQVRDAVLKPKPLQRPGPPLLLGGSGNGVLRRAGRWADYIHMTPAIGGDGTTTIPAVAAFNDAVVDEKLALVRAEAVRAGRSADAVRYASTIYNYAPTRSITETKDLAEQLCALFGLTPTELQRHPVVLIGTAEEIRDEVARRVEAHGLSQLTINFAGIDQLRDFGERVLPKL